MSLAMVCVVCYYVVKHDAHHSQYICWWIIKVILRNVWCNNKDTQLLLTLPLPFLSFFLVFALYFSTLQTSVTP